LSFCLITEDLSIKSIRTTIKQDCKQDYNGFLGSIRYDVLVDISVFELHLLTDGIHGEKHSRVINSRSKITYWFNSCIINTGKNGWGD
jgi:hypothetical protein